MEAIHKKKMNTLRNNKKANDGLPQKQSIKSRASYLLVARNMNLLRILFVGQGLHITHLNN